MGDIGDIMGGSMRYPGGYLSDYKENEEQFWVMWSTLRALGTLFSIFCDCKAFVLKRGYGVYITMNRWLIFGYSNEP